MDGYPIVNGDESTLQGLRHMTTQFEEASKECARVGELSITSASNPWVVVAFEHASKLRQGLSWKAQAQLYYLAP